MALNQNTPTRQIERPGYSDISTNLTQHPIKRDLSLVTNEDAVKRSMRNILLTNKGERPLDPEFGVGLNRYLFEHASMSTSQIIKTEIRNAIESYEPRAIINNINVSADSDRYSLLISITFTTVNSVEPQRLDVVLDRVR